MGMSDWEPIEGQAVAWACDGGAEDRGAFLWRQDCPEWSTVEVEGGQLVAVPTAYLRPTAGRGGQLTLI